MGPSPAEVTLHAGTKVLQALISAGAEKNGFTLIGRSWAADATAFVIPELNAGFDAGYIVHGKRLPYYFLTHVHCDHSHMLTHLKSRSKPPMIFLPEESTEHAKDFLDAAQKMTSHMTPNEYQDFAWTKAYELKGVRPGDRFVVNKKESLWCDVVKCDHTVPCVGYRLLRIKQKLKDEYADLPGAKIGELRKSGTVVTQDVETPLVAFLGDTTVAGIFGEPGEGDCSPDVLHARKVVTSTPVVVIECSFLTDDHKEQAANVKHVLWSELRPHVEANPDTLFVLTHGPEDSDSLEEIWGHS
eukprot:Rhum_TRINITY_DN2070_c0_g1::Rhum_TRINITY_DN2070_c0_g1_i1::g.5677::m.5677/K00784/rnz; ribonuclease Z